MTVAEYFDRIYVVNLPERTDRRRRVMAQIQQAGLGAFPGKVELFPAVKVGDADGFMNAGLRGCFLSHYTIIQRAKAAGLKRVLVVEDDLVIPSAFRESEAGVVEALETQDWGFAYLGHVLPATRQQFPAVMEEHRGPVLQTHFYGVNGPVFDRLLEYMHGVLTWPRHDPRGSRISPDGAFSMFRDLNPDVRTLVAQPNLGEQGSSASDIMPRWFDRIGWLRPIIASARNLKYRLMGTRRLGQTP